MSMLSLWAQRLCMAVAHVVKPGATTLVRGLPTTGLGLLQGELPASCRRRHSVVQGDVRPILAQMRAGAQGRISG